MDQQKRHPLDCITCKSGLSNLECLIPFVDYPLKLPLALFIKFYEIKLIINAFQSLDSITSCGLHNMSNSPTDMLCALTGMPKEMLSAVMTMTSQDSGNMGADWLSSLAGMGMGQDFTAKKSSVNPPVSNGATDDLNQNISDIFAKYDMEQAERYEKELK